MPAPSSSSSSGSSGSSGGGGGGGGSGGGGSGGGGSAAAAAAAARWHDRRCVEQLGTKDSQRIMDPCCLPWRKTLHAVVVRVIHKVPPGILLWFGAARVFLLVLLAAAAFAWE